VRISKYRLPKKYLYFVFFIDFIGYIIFGILKILTNKQYNPNNLKKILLIRLDHIGDLVLLTPVFKPLREKFPQSQIDIVVGRWAREIVENNIYINNIIEFDAFWFDREKNKKLNIKKIFNFIKYIRNQKYDLGIEFRGDIRNILLFSLSGIKCLYGCSINGFGFLLDKEVIIPKGIHQVERNILIIKKIGVNVNKPEFYIPQTDIDKKIVEEILYKLNIKYPLICIHPGVGRPSGRWTVGNFAELCDLIAEYLNAEILLIGGDKEREIIGLICRKIKNINKVKILKEKITLQQLTILIGKCNFFVGLESGPAHLAAASGINGIVIFSGIVEGDEFNPWSDKIKVIRKKVKCSPCGKFYCINNICMKEIHPQEILKYFY